MTIEQQIIKSLHGQTLTCSQIARHIGINAFKCREWLREMCSEGSIVHEIDGKYGLPSGGYSPGGSAA